jgi:RNA polymerase subunit RPABC4/transcription elongation factor Spt4
MDNNDTVCKVCGGEASTDDFTMFHLRGIDGTQATGRIICKGEVVCPECGSDFGVIGSEDYGSWF